MSNIGEFFDQLETSLSGGIPLVRALNLIADNLGGRLRRKVVKMASDINSGMTFSGAMERTGSPFTEMQIAFIKFGEETGCLDQACSALAKHAGKEVNLQRDLITSLAYPLFVLFAVMCFMPVIAAIMDNKEIVTAVPGVIKSAVAFLGILLGLFIGYKVSATQAASSILIHVPFVGSIFQKVALARFTRAFGMGLTAGVPLRQSLETAIKVTDNPWIQSQLKGLHTSIQQGKGVAEGMRNVKALPNSLKELISVGEKSGKLPEMLEKTANKFDEDAQYRIKVLSKVLPIIIFLPVGIYAASMIIEVGKKLFSGVTI